MRKLFASPLGRDPVPLCAVYRIPNKTQSSQSPSPLGGHPVPVSALISNPCTKRKAIFNMRARDTTMSFTFPVILQITQTIFPLSGMYIPEESQFVQSPSLLGRHFVSLCALNTYPL